MRENTLNGLVKRIQLYIFMLLILLQVNFFHLPFLPEGLISLNSDINKQLVLLVIISSFIIFILSYSLLPSYKLKKSFTASIVVFVGSLIVLMISTTVSYKIPLFQSFENSYYYWIILYFFPGVFVFKNSFSTVIRFIKVTAFIDIIVLLAQDVLYFYFGKMFLSLDEFSLNMLSLNNRFVVDGDFLLLVAFITLIVAVKDKHQLSKFDIIYLFLFAIHQIFFSRGRVALLIFVAMLAGFFLHYIVKLPTVIRYILIMFYFIGGIVLLYRLLISLSFFSGERAISGQVRLYEIQYYLGYAKLHGLWGLGFTNDQALLHGGVGQIWGGKYSFTDVGVIGYIGIFGWLGVPFLIAYLIQLVKLWIKPFSMGVVIITFAYFIGQWATLFPLNISRIFSFSVASAIMVVLSNQTNLTATGID